MHTHTAHARRCASFAILTGFMILSAGGISDLRGGVSETGQGSTVESQRQRTEERLHAAPSDGTVPIIDDASGAGLQLVGGMALILLGCAIHAVLVKRREHDRCVPVHASERPSSKRHIDILWVEKEIYV